MHAQDAEHELAHDAATDVALPELPLMRQLPPFEVDAETGAVAGVLGGLEMLGRACATSRRCCPARASSRRTSRRPIPRLPLGLAGRAGEPVVVLLGEHEFELDC